MEERPEYDFSQEIIPEREEEELPQQRMQRNFVIPDSKVKLLACERCKLIKSEAQWKASNSCQNCKFHDKDYKKFTTNKYQGIIGMMDFSKSWIRKRLPLSKNSVPGLYAIDVKI